MNTDIKITVIIPVYNTERYLSECLESVIHQTISSEIEIICVDDGSTDDSLKILSGFSKKNSQLIVLHQENKGAGAARNCGLNLARGKYLCFLDADDFYPNSDVLQMLYDTAEQRRVNICGGSICYVGEDGKFLKNHLQYGDEYFENDGYIKYMDFQGIYFYHRFIYLTNFIRDNQLCFPLYRRYQDPPFFVRAMIIAQEFYAVRLPVYNYRVEYKATKLNQLKLEDALRGIRDVLTLTKVHKLEKAHMLVVESANTLTEQIMECILRAEGENLEVLLREVDDCIDWSIFSEQEKGKLNAIKLLEKREWAGAQMCILKERLKEGYSLYLYGAGRVGRQISQNLKDRGYDIKAFIVSDISKNTNEVEGITVEEWKELVKVKQKAIVIITTIKYKKEIEKRLKELEVDEYYTSEELKLMLMFSMVEDR